MNKYQEALDDIKCRRYQDDWDNWCDVFDEDDEAIATLQELVNFTKTNNNYTKQQLIDELDLVYTLLQDKDLKHYADIYRLIERVVQGITR